jgi:hypothetical protein
MSPVIVLHARLPGHFDRQRADALLLRLPYARRLELERHEAGARVASLVGLELVLAGTRRLPVGPVPPSRWRFPMGEKPYFDGGPFFSISHTPTRVAVALSADGEVGIDLEDLCGDEAERDVRQRELRRWTATEATLKALAADLRAVAGVRLASDLRTAELAGRRVHLSALDLGADAVAQLATAEPVTAVTIEETAL